MVCTLEHLFRSVVFGGLSDVHRIDGRPVFPGTQRNGGREGAATELDSGNGGNGPYEVANSIHQRLADQRVTFGKQNGRLAVDEEVALPAGAQYEVAATKSALLEQLEQSVHEGVPPRPSDSRNHEATL